MTKSFGRAESITALAQLLGTTAEKAYVTGHWRTERDVVRMVKNSGFRTMLLIRDPRDLFLSFADYQHIGKPRHMHRRCPELAACSWKEMVIGGIRGLDLPNYLTRTARQTCANWLTWQKEGALVLRYEELLDSVALAAPMPAIAELGIDPVEFLRALTAVRGSKASETINKGVQKRWVREFDAELTAVWNEHAYGLATEFGYPECP